MLVKVDSEPTKMLSQKLDGFCLQKDAENSEICQIWSRRVYFLFMLLVFVRAGKSVYDVYISKLRNCRSGVRIVAGIRRQNFVMNYVLSAQIIRLPSRLFKNRNFVTIDFSGKVVLIVRHRKIYRHPLFFQLKSSET